MNRRLTWDADPASPPGREAVDGDRPGNRPDRNRRASLSVPRHGAAGSHVLLLHPLSLLGQLLHRTARATEPQLVSSEVGLGVLNVVPPVIERAGSVIAVNRGNAVLPVFKHSWRIWHRLDAKDNPDE